MPVYLPCGMTARQPLDCVPALRVLWRAGKEETAK